MMLNSKHTILAIALVMGMTTAVSEGQPPKRMLYALQADSTYQGGCFDPCDCPSEPAYPMNGTFALSPAGFSQHFAHYKVSSVKWQVNHEGGTFLITGDGTYKIGGDFALTHQLELDLFVDGAPAEHFDSGLIPVDGGFPVIEIVVSINGIFCLDKVLTIHAAPLPQRTPIAYELSADQSTYEEGCFPPCRCPTFYYGTVEGGVTLTTVGSNSQFEYFKVTGVDWKVSLEHGAELAVSGEGMYKLGKTEPLMHRLQLDLTIGDQPVRHFDSGLVPVAGEPSAIDTIISVNGVFCYDWVFHVVAKPVR